MSDFKGDLAHFREQSNTLTPSPRRVSTVPRKDFLTCQATTKVASVDPGGTGAPVSALVVE